MAREVDDRAQASEYFGIQPAQAVARSLYIDARERIIASENAIARVRATLHRYGDRPTRPGG